MSKPRLLGIALRAGALELLGIAVAAMGTYLAGRTTGTLRWIVPIIVALLYVMISAVFAALREAPARPGVHVPSLPPQPAIAGVLVLLILLGGVGLGVSAGVRYAVGYYTGKETGPDRLVAEQIGGNRSLRMTVEHVWHTRHFTRVQLTVRNNGSQPVSLPLFGYCVLSAADGTTLSADPFRSEWTTQIAPQGFQRGVVNFRGHLPQKRIDAVLSFTTVFGPGASSLSVRGISLRRAPT